MNYIKTMYGDSSDDFIRGFLAAIDTYAVWKDGQRWIGSPERDVKLVMREAVTSLGGDPQAWNIK